MFSQQWSSTKGTFQDEDLDLDFAKAIQVAIESEDAAKVTKEPVYGFNNIPVHEIEHNKKGFLTKNQTSKYGEGDLRKNLNQNQINFSITDMQSSRYGNQHNAKQGS